MSDECHVGDQFHHANAAPRRVSLVSQVRAREQSRDTFEPSARYAGSFIRHVFHEKDLVTTGCTGISRARCAFPPVMLLKSIIGLAHPLPMTPANIS